MRKLFVVRNKIDKRVAGEAGVFFTHYLLCIIVNIIVCTFEIKSVRQPDGHALSLRPGCLISYRCGKGAPKGDFIMSSLRIKDKEDVRWIYFNRPEKLNALTREDIVDAKSALQEAVQTKKGIVFTGAGNRAFSSGVHVESFRGMTPQTAREFITDLKDLLWAVRTAPIPTICAIRGYCIGGAMELAMACDIRIVAKGTKFGMPEIQLGIPSVLDAALLQQHVGLAKAKEMLLTGDLYSAEELERYGFINRLVDAEELEQVVEEMLARLTPHTRTALASQKRLFEVWQQTHLEESIRRSIDEFSFVFTELETLERIQNYTEKRKR